MNVVNEVELRELHDNPETRDAVARLFDSCKDYFLLVEGHVPSTNQVEDFFTGVPDGFTPDDLMLHAVVLDHEWVGVTSVLKGWNRVDKCMLGLMLLGPQARGKGAGRAALSAIESVVCACQSFKVLRVGVVETNTGALAFWRKMGFVETGEVKSRPEFVAPIIIFEKNLE